MARLAPIANRPCQDSALHIIPPRYVARPTYAALQDNLRRDHPTKTFHTTFDTFQALNSKSASKTLRDTFAKMLLCVKGMSAERVAAVIDVWDTPMDMWEAIKQREKELAEAPEPIDPKPSKGKRKVRGMEMFFADTVTGQGRAAIGDALSREVSSDPGVGALDNLPDLVSASCTRSSVRDLPSLGKKGPARRRSYDDNRRQIRR